MHSLARQWDEIEEEIKAAEAEKGSSAAAGMGEERMSRTIKTGEWGRSQDQTIPNPRWCHGNPRWTFESRMLYN